MLLQENTIFDNRYQLERLLGRGGFSEVWLAKDNWTRLQIAIKVYAPGQGMEANGLQDFCGELANVFDLNHTNLLKPTHVDSWNDMPYLIMAYCSNGSLASKIGQLSEQEIWKLIHDVASGLAYLHSREVVHQDIKPDNILIDDLGNYVITDFGISTRARSTLRKSVVGGSASGGTTAYMGPERFSRQPAPTKASDVWSFGAMVYEVLEGIVPFGEIGGGLQKGGAEIPYIAANVSDALKFTVYKMLSKETWDRPTAETLMNWAQNPNSIEINYDLLNVEEQPQAPTSDNKLEENPEQQKSSRKTQRFSSSSPASSQKNGLSLSFETITASSEPNIFHVVDVKSDSEWSANISDNNAQWLHCYKRSDGTLSIWCDKNSKTESRSAHVYVSNENEQKSILVIQKAATKDETKSKTWIWILVFMLVGIGTAISISVHNQKEQERREIQALIDRHDVTINDFDRSLDSASMDNIEALENALKYLRTIEQIEDNDRYSGSYRYSSKRLSLLKKTDELYKTADQRYQLAPPESAAEKRNMQKRRKLFEIKQKI